jgi:hypothetical protein
VANFEAGRENPTTAASVPAFISRIVRQGLADLRYPKAVIDKMTPDEAQTILAQSKHYGGNGLL